MQPVIYGLYTTKYFVISNQATADIKVEQPVVIQMVKKRNYYQGRLIDGKAKVNHLPIEKAVFKLYYGDILEVGTVKLSFYAYEFQLLLGEIQTKFSKLKRSLEYLPKDYPEFYRSPRLIDQVPAMKMTIDNPPAEITNKQENLVKIILPPIVMLCMSIFMLFVRPRGIYMLATIVTTIISIFFSIHAYFKDKKQYKQDVQERIETYTQYYEAKVQELFELTEKQRQVMQTKYPSLEMLIDQALKYDNKIFEKAPNHDDFLGYSLGLGTVQASFEVQAAQAKSINLKDPLEQKAHDLVKNSRNITNMPVIVDLISGPVGYVGARPLVIEQIQNMMIKLGVNHSYHEVQIIAFFPEEEYEEFAWLRWLPQISKDQKYYNFVFNQKSRDLVLNNLHELLKERMAELKERTAQDQITFLPQYVLVITDMSQLRDHPIMELLTDDAANLGVSLVYVEDNINKLPEQVQTVIEIRDNQNGRVIIQNGNVLGTNFNLEHAKYKEDLHLVPRILAGLEHRQTMKSTIPNAITFLEMYDVKHVEELNLAKRWQNHFPYKSLAVPLGVNGPAKDDLIELNLHEKAHGPHGLVAGTTGSGKSEIIQSYILSLAVNFHPYDVAFLLIDYKGGGMANLFRKLPHLLGTITNLDGTQSMRALISINAELKRRQQLFADNNVNHINQYQKLYKEGKVTTPMPHLFLISDEFAELKAEQPEFMQELISTARIGRSLGIHLILATQKPAGVVNDQIWSNSKFKLALKVADKADSMEMLKTPDAAEITEPGRAYLQVGNNEVYELFQSAWSGADYKPDEESTETLVINRLDKLGIAHSLVEDLSGLDDQKGPIQAVPTELEAVIEYINDYVTNEQIVALPRPWLPPLPNQIAVSDLEANNFKENWSTTYHPLVANIGLLDIPSKQAQEPVKINLTADGNLALFSSPGYGKSTFLQTVVMELARTLTPEQVNFYLLDFGTNGLLPLKKLPHVADTIQSDEDEKINKLIKRLETEIKERKNLLSQQSVANVEMYEQATGQIVPRIVLVLDNYEGFKDLAYEANFNSFLIRLAREGQSLGIHMILSASAVSSMRTPLLNNLKDKVVLRLNNEGDITTLIGRSKFTIDDLPGRGMINIGEPLIFQTAMPTNGDNALEVIQNLEVEIDEMNEFWQGERPLPLPMMPNELLAQDFFKRRDVKENIENKIAPLGLDYENVQVQGINLEEATELFVIGNKATIMKRFFNYMLSSLSRSTDFILLDTTGQYEEQKELAKGYVSSNDVEAFFAEFKNEIQERQEAKTNETQWVVVDDAEKFMEMIKLTNKDFAELFENGKNVGIKFLMMANYTYASDYSSLIKALKNDINEFILLMKLSEQTIFDKPYMKQEVPLKENELYYSKEGTYTKLKYPN